MSTRFLCIFPCQLVIGYLQTGISFYVKITNLTLPLFAGVPTLSQVSDHMIVITLLVLLPWKKWNFVTNYINCKFKREVMLIRLPPSCLQDSCASSHVNSS
jgi:hypothetical protein